MNKPTPIEWNVSYEHLLLAVQWSCKKIDHSIDRPGMNRRGLTESLDDKIMGDVATIAFQEFLEHNGISSVPYDEIRVDNFEDPDPGWDIAFGKDLDYQLTLLKNPKNPVGLKKISVKSSRLPRYDTLDKAIETRDFKIFAHYGKEIDECITADIETQVYYGYERSQLGKEKVSRDDIKRCKSNLEDAGYIIDLLDIEQRFGVCYLTAWNKKEDIVRESFERKKSGKIRTWNSYGKNMWIAPMRNGRSISELPELL